MTAKGKGIHKFVVVAGIAALGLGLAAAPAALKTPAEEAGYKQYSQNEAIGRFLSEADALARELTVQVVGRTRDVEGFAGQEIFLAVLTEEGAARPQDLDRKKPTLLLTAAQHGNEQSAKEAALRLIRDIGLGEMKPLLKKLNVLIMPQTNPYGNWFDVRRNETGLDMNRDHVKLEAAGVEAIHRVFRAWMPEVTIDVHEKGDDYYKVNVGCVSNANISRLLQDYSRRTVLAEVEAALKKKNITFHEYLVTEEMGSTGAAGVETPGAAAAAPKEEFTRYSTTDLNDGRNSLGIYETLSFIQEGASRHDLETLEARTRDQYYGLRFFMESAAEHGVEILKIVRDLRGKLVDKGAAYAGDDLVHLRMDFARDPKKPTLTLQKYEEPASGPSVLGVLKVDKKAGETLTGQDIVLRRRMAGPKVVTEVIKNWFPEVTPTLSVVRPLGYIIPAKHADVVETMLRHGIAVGMFIQDKAVEVEAYDVLDIVPAADDYLAPSKIVVEKKAVPTIVRRGDFYVGCGQEAANLIPCLLEPESDFGFIRYRKFGLVPKAGDIFAFYRVVKPQTLLLAPYKPWPAGSGF
ncbi:MAG: M14 family zinc carboxypeptidase [Candidatus Aminicenantales bacterium]